MTYIPDLTLFNSWSLPYGPILAIEWLDGSQPYTKGKAPLPFLQKMKAWALEPRESLVMRTRGCHTSNLKEIKGSLNASYTPDVFSYENPYRLDNGEFHVVYKNKFYVAPAMIFDYIMKYNYLPPKEFIDAVIHGKLVTEEELEKALFERDEQLDGDAIQAMFELANKELESEKYQEAIQIIAQLLAKCPNEPLMYALRGIAHYKMGELEKSRKDFLLILFTMKKEGGHNYGQLLAYLGKISQDEGDIEKAREYLQEAVRVAPEDAEVKGWLDALT